MRDILNIFNATLLKVFLTVIVVCVPLVLISGEQLIRRIRLSRKIPGPSLWQLLTCYGRQLMSRKIVDCIRELSTKYNYKPWGFWGGADYIVVISDPDTVGEALKNKHVGNKPEILYGPVGGEVGDNMLILNGPKWKRHRSAFNPTFKKSILEQNLDTIYEETERVIANLKQHSDGTDFDIYGVLEKLIFLIVAKSLGTRDFKASERDLDDIAFYIDFLKQKIFDMTATPIYYYLQYFRSKKKEIRRYNEVRPHIFQIFRNSATNMMQHHAMGKTEDIGTPLGCALIDNEYKQTLTQDESLSNLMIVCAAGVDTTSSTIAACVYLLAIHPQVQQRAAEEVHSIFGGSSRPITAEDLTRLEYLERIIKESLRLLPPVPIFLRKVDEDSDLRGTVVPKGSLVMFNIASLHRNPNVHKDPLKFDPDRFLPENLKGQHRYAFIPFSSGPRDCIGRVHAMMTMKTVLSTLLRKYKIFPGRGMNSVEDIKTKWYLTLNMYENFVRLLPLT